MAIGTDKLELGKSVYFIDTFPQLVKIINESGGGYEVLTDSKEIISARGYELSADGKDPEFLNFLIRKQQRDLADQKYKLERLESSMRKLFSFTYNAVGFLFALLVVLTLFH